MKNTLYINLFGSPGSGKSVVAALIFAELKILGNSCELIREVAKDMIYEDIDITQKKAQKEIFKKQVLKEESLLGKVDFAVTDSPSLLNAYYSNDNLIIKKSISGIKNEVNIWIDRTALFESEGRIHTEEESQKIKDSMKEFLIENNIPLISIGGENSKYKTRKIIELLKEKNYLK